MKRNLLVTYHPATLDEADPMYGLDELLATLEDRHDTLILFTAPNADTAGRSLLERIETFVTDHADHCVLRHSLGRVNYLSALQFVDAVVGNSSSGIVEVPSFRIGTVNIGNRQKGRVRAASIIDCATDRVSIKDAIRKAYSPSFQRKLQTVNSLFGDGYAARRIKEILLKTDFDSLITKHFYDLPQETIPTSVPSVCGKSGRRRIASKR
jgi:GDP/UDP-N,N'-diacetylbacillosamine 2-epimerase (hydrolysing)